MRFRPVLAIGAAALLLSGCGSANNTAETAKAKKQLATKTEGAKRPPKVSVPQGPPPKHLVVTEQKKGSGLAAKWGDSLAVQYVGVNYKTRKTFETRWQPNPFHFNFGTGEVRKGWEIGLKGIRVGGRRKLILPSRLAYGRGALVYVVELLSIERVRRCEQIGLC